MAGIFLITVSMVLFSMHLTKQKISTPSDLEIIQGKMLNYSFVDGYRGRHYYNIFLDGEIIPYKIPADFLRCFDKSSFESMVHAGDFLKLSFNKKLFVFSISDTKRSYLSADSTIEIYNKSDIQAGFVMFLLGVAILTGRYFYRRSSLLLL
jgi:hypothetical protein